jgi:hypothetical protein
MPGEMVIAAYRPLDESRHKPLLELVRMHNTTLRVEGLITDRPAQLMQAKDGTLLEIFEWKPGAAQTAHDHPAIKKLWKKMEEVAEFVPLISLQEAETPFPHFRPIDGVVT